MNLSDLPFIVNQQKQYLSRLLSKKRKFDKNDLLINNIFQDQNTHNTEKMNKLVHYFWEAHKHYVHSSGTLAYYPGFPSIYGAKNDAIEGVTRLLPLWASYICSPLQEKNYQREISIHIKNALLHGTDKSNRNYWGDIKDKSTLICEAADVALSVWLIRKTLWLEMTASQQSSILSWLKQVVGKKTADNNWHLFVVMVDLVIESMDKTHLFQSQSRYERVKGFYVGNGCFTDGENGKIDYYNAWAFHYLFFWIKKINPDYDSQFLDKVLEEYVSWYQFLFTASGYPLYGRSLCYRMAAPAPVLSAVDLMNKVVSPGEALEILASCWKFFISQKALKNGSITQGVFEDELLWLDPYSGPASSFWSVRSLVVYYYLSSSIDWGSIKSSELPATKDAVNMKINAAGFSLVTKPQPGLSMVRFDTNNKVEIKLQRMSLKDKIREKIYASACRPANNLQALGMTEFSSDLKIYRKMVDE